MRIQAVVVAVLVSSMSWSVPAMAQQRAGSEPVEGRHIADPSLMRQALADQAATDRQNRDLLIGAMRRSDVRDLADQLGLSLTRAESAVSTLNSVELARMAAPVRAADADMAGGASNVIVISTTTLLLLLIIVILLVR